MAQFRKDPFGPAWVMISPERGLEASDFGSALRQGASSVLAPGNEAQLGRELRVVRQTGALEWRMRVIEHPSALLQEKPFTVQTDELLTHAPSSGYQELIVEHPDPLMTLERMPFDHLVELLKLYKDRLELLAAKPDICHVQLTRNVGKVAGARYDHPYAHILAVPVPNRWVEEELSAAQAYFERHKRSLFQDVVNAEIAQKERLISYNDDFAVIAPYASKTPFEMWLLPRRQSSSFWQLASNTLPQLASLLQSVLRAMNGALNQPPYNMILHTLVRADDKGYSWHLEILPRLTKQAGFDWESGFYLNPTPPEDAARFLREALAMQEVQL